MTNILIVDLMPAGSGLFLDSENLINSMQDLSENELKMTFGGKHGKSKKSKSSKSSKSSHSSSNVYGCPPGGGHGGGGGGGNGDPNA